MQQRSGCSILFLLWNLNGLKRGVEKTNNCCWRPKRWKMTRMHCLLIIVFLVVFWFRYSLYNLCRGSRDIRCSKGCNHHHQGAGAVSWSGELKEQCCVELSVDDIYNILIVISILLEGCSVSNKYLLLELAGTHRCSSKLLQTSSTVNDEVTFKL